jgi:hypothetical protein
VDENYHIQVQYFINRLIPIYSRFFACGIYAGFFTTRLLPAAKEGKEGPEKYSEGKPN